MLFDPSIYLATEISNSREKENLQEESLSKSRTVRAVPERSPEVQELQDIIAEIGRFVEEGARKARSRKSYSKPGVIEEHELDDIDFIFKIHHSFHKYSIFHNFKRALGENIPKLQVQIRSKVSDIENQEREISSVKSRRSASLISHHDARALLIALRVDLRKFKEDLKDLKNKDRKRRDNFRRVRDFIKNFSAAGTTILPPT